MKRLFVLVVTVFVCSTTLAWSQQLLDGIAAIVGDEIILESEVAQYAATLALQMKLDIQNEPQKFNELQKNSLQNLIVQKILLTKAREDTIVVEDSQVEQVLEQQINQWIQQIGSERKVEEYFGSSMNKIKRRVRKEIREHLMVEKLQQEKLQEVKITRQEVEQFYQTNRDSLPELKESVEISHILLQVTPGAESKQQAREKIAGILERLRSGEDFAELARQYSEDPGSAAKGGELGFIQRGDFVKDFEEKAFALQPGQISDIVETQFGFHIIQMLERRGEKINVRHILIRTRPTKADEERTLKLLLAIRDSCLAGADFAEMAKRYSNDETTADKGGYLGWFEVEKLQLPEFKSVVKELKIGEISQPFRTRFGYHIVKLLNRREGGKLSLQRDWEQIEQWALMDKRSRAMQKWVEELKKNLYIEIKDEIKE
ncbi:parvulin peptidyl-prolyl isomerase [candidate division KSB1 bacterium]|nr:MAG: parvulin peptidyl-prolyl isomerase [candidate division KSB1 bacterium]RKY87543.1 MAG: parvulin peptidyl-prolyl isomerase [candidate division KSB1 bacterium]